MPLFTIKNILQVEQSKIKTHHFPLGTYQGEASLSTSVHIFHRCNNSYFHNIYACGVTHTHVSSSRVAPVSRLHPRGCGGGRGEGGKTMSETIRRCASARASCSSANWRISARSMYSYYNWQPCCWWQQCDYIDSVRRGHFIFQFAIVKITSRTVGYFWWSCLIISIS